MPGRRGDGLAVLDAEGAPGGGPGFSVQAMAELSAGIGRVAGALQAQADRQQQLWAAVRPLAGIPVPPITTASGTADYPELLSPRTGYWWEVKLAGAQTFSAGSVNLYLTGVSDSTIVGAFPQAGYLTYSGQQLLINWNQRLIFKAVSVTGNVTPSLAVIEIADSALPAYLL